MSSQPFSSLLRQRLVEKLIGLLTFVSFHMLANGNLWLWQYPSPALRTTSACDSGLILVCAFVNVVSHLAVVLNAIQQSFVLSILIGVGFDLFSSTLYLLSANQLNWILWLWLLRDVFLHTQALRSIYTNVDHLKEVVSAATRNLQGDPGRWCMDHIFAYTDLGKHTLFWVLAIQACGWILAVRVMIGTLAVLAVGLWWAYRPAPAIVTGLHSLGPDQAKLTIVQQDAPFRRSKSSLKCSCAICKNRTSFSIWPSLCQQWFCSFEELLDKIENTDR